MLPELLLKPKIEWPTTAEIYNVEDVDLELIKNVSIVSLFLVILSNQFRLQDVIDCKRSSTLH